MKHTFFVLAVAMIALLSVETNYVSAQEPTCIDQVQTNRDVIKCGNQLVAYKETTVDNQFNRLSEKFKGKDGMQDMLRITKQSWNNYRNVQCAFESAVVAGGQTTKPLPVEANKAFLRCVVRTLDEMISTLSKL